MNAQMLDYFSRQSAIPEIGPSGLEKLQSVKLAVVGTGGVGSAAAYFLSSLGVGHLKLIDQDIVDETNLHRLVGADDRDLHLPKSEVLGRRLGLRHRWTKIEAVVETLRRGNSAELLSDVDLIVDGTDNFPARSILNRCAMENNLPYLFTSAIANQGHLSLFTPPTTPCLECLMPPPGPMTVDSCETLGVTPTIVGMIGSLAAAEAAKRVLGLSTRIQGHLLTVDLAGPDFFLSEIKRRESCKTCNGYPSKAVHRDDVVMLCGDNVANVLPGKDLVIDLQSVKTRIPERAVVASSESVLVYTKHLHRISLFKTGRMLIGNVHTEEDAKQVAREVWKEILT